MSKIAEDRFVGGANRSMVTPFLFQIQRKRFRKVLAVFEKFLGRFPMVCSGKQLELQLKHTKSLQKL